MSRSLRLAIHVLFLLSGATALVYQVTWLRNLSLVFGASFEATSIVLAAFMAGLSAGSFVFARRAESMKQPLAVYGLLEIGIAVFALVVPALLRGLDAAYVAAAVAADGEVTVGLNVLRVGMALAILFVPTFLMGGTLPILTRGMVERYGDFGERLSWLYGINTLGAVVGAVAAGFVLIPALGVWNSQLVAVAANAVIGAAAILGSRQHAAETAAAAAKVDAATMAAPPLSDAARRAAVLAYWGTAVSGLCALALEVMWTRGIAIAVGTTTYSFTVMLAAFLSGIWLGSWLHAAFPLKRISVPVQFGFVLCIIGLSSMVASFWIPRLPELAIPLNFELYGGEGRIRGATALLLGFLVMLVPCLFMGIAFPLAGQARAMLGSGFGRSAGETLGLNTLGSIAGSLLAGFVLTPYLGLQRGMLLVAAVYVVYGCIVLAAGSTRVVLRGPAAALALLAVSVPFAAPSWDVGVMGAFQNTQVHFYLAGDESGDVRKRMEGWTVLYYEEGRVSTVTVVDQGWDRTLIVNGKAVASDDPVDSHIQLLLGHVPVLMHPDPKSAVIVGMGTGITLGSITAHEGLDSVVLAEIEPAVLGARPFFAGVNGDPLGDPRLEIEIQDGRNYLKTTPRRFDVITADPIHPFTRGSAYLYTREYYEIAKSRLTEQGVMCQWLPITALSVDDVKSVIGTFAGAFPHTTVWQSSHDTILIGSLQRPTLDLPELERRLAQPKVRQQLAPVGLADAYAFAAELGMDPSSVAAYTKEAIQNTDDNLYLEFSSPLHIGHQAVTRIAKSVARSRRTLASSPSLEVVGADPARLEVFRKAKSDTVLARLDNESATARLFDVVKQAPGYQPARIHLARRLARQGTKELDAGRVDAAIRQANAALRAWPRASSAHLLLGAAFAQQGRIDDAVTSVQQALSLRPERWMAHYQLAEALARSGRGQDALASLDTAQSLNPPHEGIREVRAALAEELGADDS